MKIQIGPGGNICVRFNVGKRGAGGGDLANDLTEDNCCYDCGHGFLAAFCGFFIGRDIETLYFCIRLCYSFVMAKRPVHVRLSEEGQRIVAAAQKKFGVDTSGTIEMALRALAEKEKLG